jgi:hypothetical protein
MAKSAETHEINVGDMKFYVRLFKALPAARISANALAVLAPLLGGAGGLLNGDENILEDIFDVDISKILPAIASGFASLEGKKMEIILRELLLDEGLISYEDEDGRPQPLRSAALDEMFCGDLFGLLNLAFQVIKLNYGSLFSMLGTQSGSRAFTPPKSLL